MAKARMYGMPRKGIPNKRCFDKHWKNERNGKQRKTPPGMPGEKNREYLKSGPI